MGHREHRGPRPGARDEGPLGWRAVAELMTRPQPVTISMVALFAIIPVYLYIGVLVHGGIVHVPELALDRAIPVQPLWKVDGEGFFAWALQGIYSSDVRYNCLPSLHVAQCFLAALTCYRVHRGVGAAAGVWAFLVGLSTLYTKQHYVLDVIAGMFLAFAAYTVFLRNYPRERTPERERRLAPVLALGAFGIYALMVAGLWLVFAASGPFPAARLGR